ncbi:hypothetical protein T439DRAFT_326592 [Meredithblackwellia eburnea MCA 4105]
MSFDFSRQQPRSSSGSGNLSPSLQWSPPTYSYNQHHHHQPGLEDHLADFMEESNYHHHFSNHHVNGDTSGEFKFRSVSGGSSSSGGHTSSGGGLGIDLLDMDVDEQLLQLHHSQSSQDSGMMLSGVGAGEAIVFGISGGAEEGREIMDEEQHLVSELGETKKPARTRSLRNRVNKAQPYLNMSPDRTAASRSHQQSSSSAGFSISIPSSLHPLSPSNDNTPFFPDGLPSPFRQSSSPALGDGGGSMSTGIIFGGADGMGTMDPMQSLHVHVRNRSASPSASTTSSTGTTNMSRMGSSSAASSVYGGDDLAASSSSSYFGIAGAGTGGSSSASSSTTSRPGTATSSHAGAFGSLRHSTASSVIPSSPVVGSLALSQSLSTSTSSTPTRSRHKKSLSTSTISLSPRKPRGGSGRKLTDLDRKNICLYREANPTVKQDVIAEKFSVERSTVSKILKNKEHWLSISEEDLEDFPVVAAPPPVKPVVPPSPAPASPTKKRGGAATSTGLSRSSSMQSSSRSNSTASSVAPSPAMANLNLVASPPPSSTSSSFVSAGQQAFGNGPGLEQGFVHHAKSGSTASTASSFSDFSAFSSSQSLSSNALYGSSSSYLTSLSSSASGSLPSTPATGYFSHGSDGTQSQLQAAFASSQPQSTTTSPGSACSVNVGSTNGLMMSTIDPSTCTTPPPHMQHHSHPNSASPTGSGGQPGRRATISGGAPFLATLAHAPVTPSTVTRASRSLQSSAGAGNAGAGGLQKAHHITPLQRSLTMGAMTTLSSFQPKPVSTPLAPSSTSAKASTTTFDEAFSAMQCILEYLGKEGQDFVTPGDLIVLSDIKGKMAARAPSLSATAAPPPPSDQPSHHHSHNTRTMTNSINQKNNLTNNNTITTLQNQQSQQPPFAFAPYDATPQRLKMGRTQSSSSIFHMGGGTGGMTTRRSNHGVSTVGLLDAANAEYPFQ